MHAIGKEHPAIANLRSHQRQLDADGCEVGVSRQAIEETLALLAVVADELRDAAAILQSTAEAIVHGGHTGLAISLAGDVKRIRAVLSKMES